MIFIEIHVFKCIFWPLDPMKIIFDWGFALYFGRELLMLPKPTTWLVMGILRSYPRGIPAYMLKVFTRGTATHLHFTLSFIFKVQATGRGHLAYRSLQQCRTCSDIRSTKGQLDVNSLPGVYIILVHVGWPGDFRTYLLWTWTLPHVIQNQLPAVMASMDLSPVRFCHRSATSMIISETVCFVMTAPHRTSKMQTKKRKMVRTIYPSFFIKCVKKKFIKKVYIDGCQGPMWSDINKMNE